MCCRKLVVFPHLGAFSQLILETKNGIHIDRRQSTSVACLCVFWFFVSWMCWPNPPRWGNTSFGSLEICVYKGMYLGTYIHC